ncbi:MAG: hypothetical protein D6744_17950 [Planctomycetota bacterium]|nr:MAG: hypothetical protein D6744_17950 [Planctomycetota bacterium]
MIRLLEAGHFKGVADARLRTLFPTPPSDAPADPNGAPLSPQDGDAPAAPAPTGADPAPAAPVEPAADGAPSAPQIHARVLAAFFADIRVAPTTSFDATI